MSPKRESADDKFLREARNRWKLAESAAEKQRQRELADLRFYAGDQWDEELLNARKGKTLGSGANQQIVPARPSLTINKTLEPVRQVLNQERQADLGYELVPADDFGGQESAIDHTEIELREGLVRRIQRDSEAEDARTWAFQRAAIAGQGYRVVMTRYLPGKRADQEVFIQRIANQNSVMLDPAHEQPDSSDIDWGFYGTDMLWDAFKSDHPDSKTAKQYSDCTDDVWRSLGDEAPGWFRYEGQGKDKNRVVRVVNYYYVEKEPKTLYHLSDGSAVYKDELQAALAKGLTQELDEDGAEQTHVETKRTVKWCKLTGNEVLERTNWPSRWIPIIREMGEELQPYDNERRAQGVVRPMRDSCKGNNYIVSKLAEYMGLQPIPPWIMAGGQDEGFEAEWDASTTRTLGRLHFNQKDQFGQAVPQPPQRVSVTTDVSGLAMGVQIFGQAIQATSVVPETALGNTDSTVKSGKLAQALIQQAEMGTSNFMDNHKRSLRHEARIVNDLLYPIYGRPGRMVQIVNGQGQHEAVIVGQPFTMEGQDKNKRPVPVPDPQNPPPNAKLYKLTADADFNIAIKISKKIDTRRAQISQFLTELVAAVPETMGVIGDKLFKYMDVPDHQELEERFKVMLNPQVQQMLSGDSPLPPEAQQKIAMLEQQLKEVMPLADDNKAKLMQTQMSEKASIEQKRMDVESREKIERWKIEAELEIEAMKLGNARAMARAEIDMDLLHKHNEQQQAREEAAMANEQAQQELQAQAQQQERDQQAQGQLSQQEHQQALQQGQQGHQQALEQGRQQQDAAMIQQDQAHQQALEQQAAQPQPPA